MPDRGRRETPTVRFSLGRAQRLFSTMGGSCMRYLMRFVLLGMVSVNLSWGQTAEAGVTVGWSAFTDSNIGRLDPQSGAGAGEFSLNNGIRIGSRLAINTWQFLGHELSYAFQRSGLQIGGVNSGGMSIQNFYYNFVVHATPQGTAVRPFVTAGAGFFDLLPAGHFVILRGRDHETGREYRRRVEVQTQGSLRGSVRRKRPHYREAVRPPGQLRQPAQCRILSGFFAAVLNPRAGTVPVGRQ